MRIATFFGTLIVVGFLVAAPTAAQNVQIPTKVPLNTATPLASSQPTWAPNYGPVAQNAGTIAPPGTYSGSPSIPYGAPSSVPSPPTTFAPQPPTTYGASPTYAPQPPSSVAPSYSYPPGVTPSYAPPGGPTATLPGTITAPPSAGWDPYATPGMQSPSMFPTDPSLPNPPAWCYPQQPTNYVETMQRFMDEARFQYIWMPGDGPQELGIHDMELSASFAIPFFSSPSPLLVTPGFATNWFNGPSPPHTPPPADPPGNPIFPPRLYEAYLDTSWNPQPTPEFGGELSFRIGVYSDFDRVTNESIRYMGKGYGVISLSPNIKLKAGVQYLDRQKIKLLPAGGLVWTPNANTKFDILFPDPRLAWRLRQVGNMEWWFYGRGEYGGDSWTISRITPWTPDAGGGVVETDYNDYRVAIGLEFDDHSRWDGYFEVGYAFEREIYQGGMATMRPNSTVFLGAGLAY